MNCFDTVSPAFDVKIRQIQLQPPGHVTVKMIRYHFKRNITPEVAASNSHSTVLR
jgi:hypothetical protein